MTRVFERLYLGSLRDAERLALMNPQSITAVISVCEPRLYSRNEHIEYVHIPVCDHNGIAPDAFDNVTKALARYIRSGRVLLHCVAGVSRSPVMVAVYMHTIGYRHFDAALRELQALRPQVEPSKATIQSAKAYLQTLKAKQAR